MNIIKCIEFQGRVCGPKKIHWFIILIRACWVNLRRLKSLSSINTLLLTATHWWAEEENLISYIVHWNILTAMKYTLLSKFTERKWLDREVKTEDRNDVWVWVTATKTGNIDEVDARNFIGIFELKDICIPISDLELFPKFTDRFPM